MTLLMLNLSNRLSSCCVTKTLLHTCFFHSGIQWYNRGENRGSELPGYNVLFLTLPRHPLLPFTIANSYAMLQNKKSIILLCISPASQHFPNTTASGLSLFCPGSQPLPFLGPSLLSQVPPFPLLSPSCFSPCTSYLPPGSYPLLC